MLVELFERRTGPQITSDGKRYGRTFVESPALAETNAPTIGSLMPGASGVTGARIQGVSITPDVHNGRSLIRITYDSLTAYSGVTDDGAVNFIELAKSRYKVATDPEVRYVRRWVWNGTGAEPVVIGDLYPGTSGLFGGVCSKINIQREWNAGRHLVEAEYSEMEPE